MPNNYFTYCKPDYREILGEAGLRTMTAPYDPRSIANFYVQRSLREKRPIDHMKLQKLIYFSHGYYLAATGLNGGEPQPLIDEFFEVWPYGPVCPSVYESFKEYGKEPIVRPALGYDKKF